MNSDSVQNIFDPIINKVVRLVGDQVEAVQSAGHSVAVGPNGARRPASVEISDKPWTC